MGSTSALTESVFYILLSLDSPLHGYAIMQHIKSITNGRINMGAGTLYGALSVLLERGYIEELQSADPSRREYRRTKAGTAVLEGEIHRLHELLHNADLYFKED